MLLCKNIIEKTLVNNGSFLNDTGTQHNIIPQINGTIIIKNNVNNSYIKNISVPFLSAAQTAEKMITNGTIINGNLDITEGFLTYNFEIFNPTNDTFYMVIVDAGIGSFCTHHQAYLLLLQQE